ncbi:glycosyltransferase, partial [Simkania negevensis]|nr:glycosyltransferase [Simkania negevensis]
MKMHQVATFIPAYNAETFLAETIQSASTLPVHCLDNGSTDATHAIASQHLPPDQVDRNAHALGRVENWNATIELFLKKDYSWMKWLFTGDLLVPEAPQLLAQAVIQASSCGMILFNYRAVLPGRSFLWRPKGIDPRESRILQPDETLYLVAKYGNIFGPPLAQCLHRDAMQDVRFSTGLHWAADMAFCLEIATKHPVFYCNEIIGEFRTDRRRVFSTQEQKLSSILEEQLVKTKA